MADDNDDDTPGLRELARRVPLVWWLPMPAVATHALTLLFSRRVWTTLIEVNTRSGRSVHVIAAHRYLTVLVIALALYAAASVFDRLMSLGHGLTRAPTDAEVSVVRALLRGLCLLVMYGGALSLVRGYVFGGS